MIERTISTAVQLIEVLAVAVLVTGLAYSLVEFVRNRERGAREARIQSFRANLGHSILSGLEILIVADIIRTVAVDPTLTNVLNLGLIVLIRTFLSFALEVEIVGTLPWRRGPGGPPREPRSD